MLFLGVLRNKSPLPNPPQRLKIALLHPPRPKLLGFNLFYKSLVYHQPLHQQSTVIRILAPHIFVQIQSSIPEWSILQLIFISSETKFKMVVFVSHMCCPMISSSMLSLNRLRTFVWMIYGSRLAFIPWTPSWGGIIGKVTQSQPYDLWECF